MKNLIFSILLLASLSGCVAQQDRVKMTATGYPEAIFKGSSVSKVRNKLLEGCENKGIPVLEATDSSVICGKEMSGGDAVLAQFLIGNKYSTTPEQKVKFTIYQSSKGTKVTAKQWIETQMAMGQIQKQDLNDNNQFNKVQEFLYSLGGK